MLLRRNRTRAFLPLAASLLALASCANLGGGGANLSADVANLAAAVDAKVVSDATTANDETSAGSETSTTLTAKSLDLGGARALSGSVSVTVTVSHSAGSSLSSTSWESDVVTVTRSWTAADGSSIVDTVVRPEVPSDSTFSAMASGSPSYAPNPATPGLAVTPGNGGSTVTISGIETRTQDGVQTSSNNFSMTYVKVGVSSRLGMVEKTGESVGAVTGNLRLNLRVWYDNSGSAPVEYLRSLDYVNGADQTLERRIVAQGLSSLSGLVAVAAPGSTSQLSGLSLSPAPQPEAGATSFDLIYETDPGAALSSYAPAMGDLSSFPSLLADRRLGVVLQGAAPRIVDWYRPVNAGSAQSPSYQGGFVRRHTYTSDGSGLLDTVYASDGSSVLRYGAAIKLRSASDGSLTTRYQFSDGHSYAITISPLGDGSDGYMIDRNGQVYTVSYARDATGALTSMTVTYEGAVTTYSQDSTGNWSASS